MRGRAGQAALKRRRGLFPFCAHCEARGIVRAAVEIDHIQPLALGGDDVDENCQGLCLQCHAVKTALEQASSGGAANHPAWLRPARCKLQLISGPPCAGKSTLVRSEAGGLDLVIDLDDLADRIAPGFLARRRWTAELLNQAIRARNSLLGSLSAMPKGATAWFIVSAPTEAERAWWADQLQPARRRHLDPGPEVCAQRARLTSDPVRLEAVMDWYRRATRPWSPEKARPGRVAIGADGYPLGTGEERTNG